MQKIIKIVGICLLLFSTCFVTLSNKACAENSTKNRYIESYFTTIAAASCLGTYLENESTEYDYLRAMGWEIEPYVSKKGNLETHFTVAKRYFKDIDKKFFIVSFRGSATKGDWKINLKTKKVNYGGNNVAEMDNIAALRVNSETPAVHGGFNTYTMNVLKESIVGDGYLRGVFGYVQENEKTVLILTGHSMGGAVATLLATRLVDLGFPKERLHVVTFGAPAVGNVAFNEAYANKLDILRITNTNDPIPGSLQTFFSGYTQCGRNEKYHLSAQIGNMQHDMAMYFDHSVINLYKVKDEEIALGRMRPTAKVKITKGVPKVALWISTSPGLEKMPLMPPVKRLLIDQYTRILPSYMIMEEKLNLDNFRHEHDLINISAKMGADYVLICGIDSRREKKKYDTWSLVQEQGLFYSNGQMLSITGFTKKVVPAIGNVQAAGENYLVAVKELRKHLPFVGPEIYGEIR